MLGNSIRPDQYKEEGIVLQVDPSSFYCKVRTSRGQILPQVAWLTSNGGSGRGGDRSCPSPGDRAMLDFGLGYPVIIGFLPRPQIPSDNQSVNIHTGESMPSVGNYGPSSAVRQDAQKPSDLHLGDRVLTSPGGALLGALRGGSVVVRAGRAAEILLSKVVGLVRVVSRNWEHFSDVSSDVIRNFKGRIYRYSGYSKVFSEAKNEDYRFHQYWGDVAVGEQIKTNYHNNVANPVAATNAIYKEQITNASDQEIMRRTIDVNGDEEVVIKIPDLSTFIRMKATNAQISFSWHDETTVIINGSKIHLFDRFGNSVIMQDSDIHAVHHAGADVIMDAAGIRATMGDSLVDITENDITSTNGAGEAFVSDATTRIKNGSHSVTVTASGVAIV